MLLSLSVNGNVLLIRYYDNEGYRELEKTLCSSYYGIDDFTLHKIYYDNTTEEERAVINQYCEPNVSMVYIGINAKNNHYNDYSKLDSECNILTITYEDCALCFTTIKVSKEHIKSLKNKYGEDKVFFTFFNDERSMLTAFVNSYKKGIQFLCFWNKKRQLKYLEYRCNKNNIRHFNVIGCYDYEAILSRFKDSTGIKQSLAGHTIQSASNKLLKADIMQNSYNTAYEFTQDTVKYMSYVFDTIFAFKNIDNKIEGTRGLFYSCHIAGIDCHSILSAISISNKMLYNAYIENGLEYVKSNRSSSETYSGAFNMSPSYNFVRHLACFDMKSFYINIIMAFKISPENFASNNDSNVCATANGSRFKNVSNKDVISYRILDRFYKLR